MFYLISYITRKGNEDHFNCKKVSNFHSIVAILLSSLSIYWNDDSIFSEEIVLSWAAGYFFADLIDCVVRKDKMFLVHAIIGITLIRFCWSDGFYYKRAGSRGYFVELSTPFLNECNSSKTKKDFTTFIAVFFVCRIAYTPYFLYMIGATENIYAFVASMLFYILNLVWFLKQSKMLLNYDEKRAKKE